MSRGRFPRPGTMTSAMMSQQPRAQQITAEELDEDIVAKPLVTPDFANIKSKNPNVSFRWIEFKAQDGLRFSQAQAQGWQVATEQDIVLDNVISPYRKDGGSKFINGDIILMKMDRRRYLGALKHKHNVAAALNDASVLRTVTAKQTVAALESAGAAKAENLGKMSVFTPGAADLADTALGQTGGAAEVGRLGGTGQVDIGGGGQ